MHFRSRLFFLTLIIALTIVSYAPALKNNFSKWDDTQYVFGYSELNEISAANVITIFTSFRQGNYVPLTFLSFAIEKNIIGESPGVFIRDNLLLHLLNTLLVFLLVRSLLLRTENFKNAAAETGSICALLFGIHPLHVESVAWIAERKDV